jgi:NAD(P)-dependent dehydrogenase (short-subunit alcohol dehydrogenase family)
MQDQQVALVTGATSGLGRAIAEKLATDGMCVIVHGRDADRGADVVRGIEARGGRARFVRADLADPTSIDRLVAELASIGPIDVLVNNAGYAWSARPRSSMRPASTRCSRPTCARRI